MRLSQFLTRRPDEARFETTLKLPMPFSGSNGHALAKCILSLLCRASNVVDAGGATMSRYEETAEPGEAEDAVDMALDSNRVLEPHVLVD